MKRFISTVLSLTMILGGMAVSGSAETTDASLPLINMAAWQYSETDDVYYQLGLSYATTPADSSYQTMGVFVPGAYFTATANGDGTYTCAFSQEGSVGGYTAASAPWILPVNTPGYSAMNAPTSYDSSFGYGSVADYTGAGMVVLYAGARGRDHGAPAGVTDFKAAIRYARYNAAQIPGDATSIFTLGMSGGGAQSAILGASGDSSLYDPYLTQIGAVMGQSDAVKGSMAWCPITLLDVADAAYEWQLGATRSGLTEEEQTISDGLAAAFAPRLNALNLTDSAGNALTLTESSDGIYQSGTYYDYLKAVIEDSLENFLNDTTFPYTASSSGGMGGMGGTPPSRSSSAATETAATTAAAESAASPETTASAEAADGITRQSSSSGGLSLSGTYDTKQAYIDALNANGAWVSWDEATNTVTITSVAAFSSALKNASKGMAAFDQLDRGQGENTLFGYGDGSGAHFDAILAELVKGTDYEAAFAEDLAKTDGAGNTVDVRVAMYNPMYYLSAAYAGFGTATPAAFWRIRSGINQGDTALTTELNLALAADSYSDATEVDFATVWGQGHTMAERTGDTTGNFISWVNACMQ